VRKLLFVFAHCLYCDRPFRAAFGELASGRRIAYDPGRHRLWLVCDGCHRWNLVPEESRASALHALERLARDEGRVLARTANVELLHARGFLLLRVGRTGRQEQAWWRYGRELRRRRHLYESRGARLSAYSFAAVASLSESVGLTDTGLRIAWDAAPIADILRWRHFGTAAWRGRLRCVHCQSVLLALRFDLSWWIHPLHEPDGSIALGVPCDRCDPWTPEKVYRITGQDARHALRRVLAYQNVAGASDRMLGEAVGEIDASGSAAWRLLPARRASLWRLGPVRRLALEILANEEAEQERTHAQAAALEATWRQENEIAEIIDRELGSLPA
jgi:hypothetical protein